MECARVRISNRIKVKEKKRKCVRDRRIKPTGTRTWSG
jgi:hypothetical protein